MMICFASDKTGTCIEIDVIFIQAMRSLELVARVSGKSVTMVMEPHKEVLQDMIPPKKHLLRHQPANAQIGLMVHVVCWFKT